METAGPSGSASSWSLRSGRSDDADAVLALWTAAGAEPTSTDDPRSIRALLRHDASALVVAQIDVHIVGTIIAGFDGWRGNLYRLAVDPAYRRRGMAMDLVREAERRLAARGSRRITALVVTSHTHARAFWESADYRYDERMGRYVRQIESPQLPL